jgi:DNA-directed RNA polymerase specialized sigma24 family protein
LLGEYNDFGQKREQSVSRFIQNADMFGGPTCSWCVQPMSIREPERWDEAIRRYDHRVYLSVLALGLPPERAREIVQSAWTRLMEKHAGGALRELELPGIAIRQARFLALNEHARSKTEKRVLAAVPDPGPSEDVERAVASRAELSRVLAALGTCTPTARKVFRLVYATPGGDAATAARAIGLSLQRVRQILCETRAHIRKQLAASESIP